MLISCLILTFTTVVSLKQHVLTELTDDVLQLSLVCLRWSLLVLCNSTSKRYFYKFNAM